jgi:hypothetical protein
MTTPATRQIWPDAVEEALDSPGGAKWHRVALQVNPYFRQLVFSTHNANIPVLGDAELLVVLESAGRKGHIAEGGAGSLDDQVVLNLAGEILEGGPDAFRRRRYLYGF